MLHYVRTFISIKWNLDDDMIKTIFLCLIQSWNYHIQHFPREVKL